MATIKQIQILGEKDPHDIAAKFDELGNNINATYMTKINPTGTGSFSMNRGVGPIGDTSSTLGNNCIALGSASHAEGRYTIATDSSSHVQGKYNSTSTTRTYAHIVGNGLSEYERSNAHTLDWNGNAWFKGNIYLGGTDQDSAVSIFEMIYPVGSIYMSTSSKNPSSYLAELG